MQIGQYSINFSQGNFSIENEAGEEIAVAPATAEHIDGLKGLALKVSEHYKPEEQTEKIPQTLDETSEEKLDEYDLEDEDHELDEDTPPIKDNSISNQADSAIEEAKKALQDDDFGMRQLSSSIVKKFLGH